MRVHGAHNQIYEISRPPGDCRLRQHRPGHVAADPAPHRHERRTQVTIVTAEDARPRRSAEASACSFIRRAADARELRATCSSRFSAPAISCSTCRSTSRAVALVELCREQGALYLDTCIEPWPGGYTDPTFRPRSAPTTRCARARWRCARNSRAAPTAVLTHGANPGLVSHFVKEALLDLAARSRLRSRRPRAAQNGPRSRAELGVKAIHIAERDTQVSRIPKQPGEFVNTWSIDGFVGEGLQPAELGWGTHERHFPADGGGMISAPARRSI